MVNTMVINQLNDIVRTIASKNVNGEVIPTKLSKKVGLALSVLTSDKGDLSYTDFVG